MNISPVSSTKFKGYDARPLKGFIMADNWHGIADEMQRIGAREKFSIFSVIKDAYQDFCPAMIAPDNTADTYYRWAQDTLTIVKNKFLCNVPSITTMLFQDYFGLKPSELQLNKMNETSGFCHKKTKESICTDKKYHVAGGNLFIMNKGDKEELLVGIEVLKKYSINELKELYSVDSVVVVPEMDFHLDLYIRPLDKQRILLADDNITLEALKNGCKKIQLYCEKIPVSERKKYIKIKKQLLSAITEFKKSMQKNTSYSSVDKTENVLTKAGYKVIRVPGRIYETTKTLFSGRKWLCHDCNYMNANAFINFEGDLVYITNKSNFDNSVGITPQIAKEIGFSIQDAFVKSILPYVKKEHIYFVDGKDNYMSKNMLKCMQGGIHCACSEVPKG